jgi:hypothetical protein
MTRLRPPDVVAGVAGAAMIIVLFLPWYGLEGRGVVTYGPGSGTATAWEAFSVTDILLALLALLAIALPVVTAAASGPAKPVAFGVLGSVGSILAVLLILYRLLNQPGPNDVVVLRYGAWLGLLAALLMLGGCWAAMRDERTPGATPPNVPRRPAP